MKNMCTICASLDLCPFIPGQVGILKDFSPSARIPATLSGDQVAQGRPVGTLERGNRHHAPAVFLGCDLSLSSFLDFMSARFPPRLPPVQVARGRGSSPGPMRWTRSGLPYCLRPAPSTCAPASCAAAARASSWVGSTGSRSRCWMLATTSRRSCHATREMLIGGIRLVPGPPYCVPPASVVCEINFHPYQGSLDRYVEIK